MAYTRTGYANLAAFPATGTVNVIYVDLSNGNEYLWSGTAYIAYVGTLAGVRQGYQDLAWFNANPNFLLGKGQRVNLLQTGQYKLGDGVTALSALAFLGGSTGVAWGAITGTVTNQTDLTTYLANTYQPIGSYLTGLVTGTTTITGGADTRMLYNNNGVLGEYAVTGTGTTAVLSTSPTFGTSIAINNVGTGALPVSFEGMVGTTTRPTLYMGVTPSATNFTITNDGSTAFFNGVSDTRISVASSTKIQCGATFIQFTTSNIGGSTNQYVFVGSNGAGQTASTNIPIFKITGANKQFATGSHSVGQYFFHNTSNTISFVAASTATLVANAAFEYAQGGTNSTVTTSAAIYVPTLALTNTTTGIGLNIEGPTGATNNYSAKFTQGTGIVSIGEYTSGRGSIWINQSLGGSTNFAISAHQTTGSTYINGSGGVNILFAGGIQIIYGDKLSTYGSGLTHFDFNFAGSNGSKLGTATSQKIGFWNATPIVQPTTAVAASTLTSNGGTTLTDIDTIDGYTLLQVVKALRNTGLLA